MIDLKQCGRDMQPKLKEFTGIPQLIKANQDVSSKELIYPRITYNFSTLYDPESRQSFVQKINVVESEEAEFEDDIEYSYITNPRTTLSINGYGKDLTQYINLARKWFQVPQLGDRFFESKNAVIVDIGDTQNRKTFLEAGHEDRQGFDVIIEFEETIKATEKTIEQVELESTSGTLTFDI